MISINRYVFRLKKCFDRQTNSPDQKHKKCINTSKEIYGDIFTVLTSSCHVLLLVDVGQIKTITGLR